MSLEVPADTSISRDEYETILEAAATYREALVVRLCGEVGLRPAELPRLSPGCIDQVRSDPPRYLLRIPPPHAARGSGGQTVDDGPSAAAGDPKIDGGTTAAGNPGVGDGATVDGEASGREAGRNAYLPTGVARELDRYARSNDIDDDERLFTVTPRRLQMLVADVTDRAADRSSNGSLAAISSDDLRRSFARRALTEWDVNPRVVKTVGGWRSFESLEPYLPEPSDDEIVDAFGAIERDRPEAPGDGGEGLVRILFDATDRYALVRLDADGYVERWNRGAAAMFGYDAAEIVGTHVSTFYAEPTADGPRVSGDGLRSDRGEGLRSDPGDDSLGKGDTRESDDGPVETRVDSRSGDDEPGASLDDHRDGDGAPRIGSDPERTLQAAADGDGFGGEGLEVEGWRTRRDGSRFRAVEVVAPRRDADGRLRGYAVLVSDVTDAYDRLEQVTAKRREFERLHVVARRHRAVVRALLESSTHGEVETGTCEALVEGDAYAFAWIDRTIHESSLREWQTTAGIEPGDVDRVIATIDARSGDGRASADGVGTPVDDAGRPDGDPPVGVDRDVTVDLASGSTFEGDVATVELGYGNTVYGTLSIGAERRDAFDERELVWLWTTGRQVAYAIAAMRRRTLLLSDTLVELDVRCRDDRAFFVEASARLDCRFELISLVGVSESTKLYYLHLEGAQPEAVVDLAGDDPGIGDCRLIETREDGWRMEITVSGSSPALTLTEYGATVADAVFEDGTGAITAECAADADLRTIVGGLRSTFPDAELRGKREVERSVRTAAEFRDGIKDRLTDKQESALRAAYFAGYYDWPRESTAEEVADAMGVSSPTLHNHLRKGQHELLRTVFDGTSVREADRR